MKLFWLKLRKLYAYGIRQTLRRSFLGSGNNQKAQVSYLYQTCGLNVCVALRLKMDMSLLPHSSFAKIYTLKIMKVNMKAR